MDGNGRWATRRGLPRAAGHRAGARAVRRAVEGAVELGVGTLTLYAFSSDNWRRPAPEVTRLLALFQWHLESEADRLARAGVRLNVIGRRDRLPPGLLRAVEDAEVRTRGGEALHLFLAVDYSSRDALVRAASLGAGELRQRLAEAVHAPHPLPDLDLLVRTGGEQRLSDFLLWECAYAELLFLPVPWPDFSATHLQEALATFRRRDRRFGGLPSPATSRTPGTPGASMPSEAPSSSAASSPSPAPSSPPAPSSSPAPSSPLSPEPSAGSHTP